MNIKAQSSGLDFDYQFCLQIQNLSLLMSSISLSISEESDEWRV